MRDLKKWLIIHWEDYRNKCGSNSMKRICFFSGDINLAGGTERVSSVIANALDDRGYKIYFLSLDNGRDPFYTLNEKISLHSLHMEGKSKKSNFFKIIKDIRIFLQTYDIDYIVGIDVISSIFTIPATFKLKTEVIAWEHFNYFAKVGNKRQNFERQIARFLASKRAKTIVTLTDKDRNYYLKNLNCKAEVFTIFNPLTIAKPKKSDLKEKVVIAVGRLTYQKGFDLLLPAWEIVKRKHDDWVLKIVGSGEDEQMLKTLAHTLDIEDCVEFVPNTKDIEQYYMNASIYVMSSRYEGFGLVLTEAKAFGLPLISFDCECGPSDIIRENIDGLLVEENNIEGMSAAILHLIENGDKRVAMGEEGFWDNRFELDGIVKKWENLFNNSVRELK